MATSTNIGSQSRTFAYKQDARALEFNKLLYGVIQPGIFEGGNIQIFDTENVFIEPFVVVIQDTDEPVSINFKTTENALINISSVLSTDGDYVLYGIFTSNDAIDNYIDFNVRTAASSPVTNEIAFGTVVISGGAISEVNFKKRNRGLNIDEVKLQKLLDTIDWPLAVTAGTGSATNPQYLVYSNGVIKLRQEITWGSGVSADLPTEIKYQYSHDSGSTYVTIATKTVTYDSTGNLTSEAWS